MTLYNNPILVPTSPLSKLLTLTTHGAIRLTNAPDQNPYTAANARSISKVFAPSHSVTHERPENRALGNKRLKWPRESAR